MLCVMDKGAARKGAVCQLFSLLNIVLSVMQNMDKDWFMKRYPGYLVKKNTSDPQAMHDEYNDSWDGKLVETVAHCSWLQLSIA